MTVATPNRSSAPQGADADRARPWSEHWQRTLTGSIDLHGEDPVAQTIRGLWKRRLPVLQRCGQIVDVGSGPAVLARLMERLGWNLQPPHVWWCLDQADLGQGWQTSLPSAVRVRAGTAFEEAQPVDGPVDAVLSNFGLEYIRLDAVAQALPRWLKPQGHIEAVMHAKGSVIDGVSREHAADLRLALDDLDLPQRAIDLAQAMASAPREPTQRMMHGVEVRDAYNAAVDRLKQVMEERGRPSAVLVDLLRGYTDTLRQMGTLGLEGAVGRLQAQAQAYRAEHARLAQMQASALDEAQALAWRDTLQAALAKGQVLQLQPLECELGLVAWNLSSAP